MVNEKKMKKMKTVYVCEQCGKTFDNKEKCIECEKQHRDCDKELSKYAILLRDKLVEEDIIDEQLEEARDKIRLAQEYYDILDEQARKINDEKWDIKSEIMQKYPHHTIGTSKNANGDRITKIVQYTLRSSL